MAKKIASKIVKEAAKRVKDKFKPNPNSTKNFGKGAPEKGTVGAYKGPKAKAKPTGVTKAKPTGVRKAKPTGVTKASPTKAKGTVPVPAKGKTSGLNKREKGALALGAATAAGFVGTGLAKRKKPASEASEVTFGEAFKAARKKGEGTKFTYKGKQYTAVTKDDLKKKGYDANELRQYANRKGKARGPLNRLGQKAKKVLLGKDKKFGGDKGAIDFIRRPKKKAAPQKKMGGGMANSSAPKKFKAGGMANKGLGKAYMNSKR